MTSPAERLAATKPRKRAPRNNSTLRKVIWVCLSFAVLSSADLSFANLRSADFSTGETFEWYLSEVVPALLTAGGKSLDDIAVSGAWDCHDWSNCPMHVAFGIAAESDGPPLLVPRIRQFVQMFDAKLIPAPVRDESGKWVFRLPEPAAEAK